MRWWPFRESTPDDAEENVWVKAAELRLKCGRIRRECERRRDFYEMFRWLLDRYEFYSAMGMKGK